MSQLRIELANDGERFLVYHGGEFVGLIFKPRRETYWQYESPDGVKPKYGHDTPRQAIQALVRIHKRGVQDV